MKSKLLILLVFIGFIFSCEEEIDPLAKELIGTTWSIEKVEVYDMDENLIRTIPVDWNNPCNGRRRSLYFRNSRHLVLGNSCGEYGTGCGEWSLENGKISYSILNGQAVSGLCRVNNFTEFFMEKKVAINLTGESLAIDGWWSAFGLQTSQADYFELQDAYNNNTINVRSFFVPADNLVLPNDLSCCGQLEIKMPF
jgi:hypothetical protein